VFLLADDLGFRDIGCYGADVIRTPRLDRLARAGVRFLRAYSNGTECSPTRTALLTGRYPHRVGGLECAIGIGNVGRYDDAIRLAGQHELGLPTDEVTISRLLKQAGYETAIIGKWHLGYDAQFAPGGHGFADALYCIGGNMDYFHHVEDPPTNSPALYENGAPVQRDGYFTDVIAEEAAAWLTRQRPERPFLLYVPFTAPHSPYQGPEDRQPAPLTSEFERQQSADRRRQAYVAMIERVDLAVGRILETLDRQGLAHNTLVVFTSDNGGTGNALPSGLRGRKGQTFEGGIRVPCLARWPGVLPTESEFPHPVATFDFTVSIARAAGVSPPADRPFDGIDVLRAVAHGDALPPRDLFWRGRRGENTWRAVREGDLKYVSLTSGGPVEEYLFDLSADESETHSLLGERAADVARLKEKLRVWEAAVRHSR
jgi:N-acetylgalactosamine-6-sulfatase